MGKGLDLMNKTVFLFSIFVFLCSIDVAYGDLIIIDESDIVTEIIDGDTIIMADGTQIRLGDIDAPEQGEAGFNETYYLLNSMIFWRKIYLDIDDLYRIDPYGRLVCVVYVDHNSTHFMNINKALASSEHVQTVDYDNEFNPEDWRKYVAKNQVKALSVLIPNHVIINEVESNPAGTDEGFEWVELFNPTPAKIDLGDWKIATTHGNTVEVAFIDAANINSKGFYLVSYNAQWLDNEDESIILFDELGYEIDRTPIFSDGDNNDNSWQRYPNSRDDDSVKDWSFRINTVNLTNGDLKKKTRITCNVDNSRITTGQVVKIFGEINETTSGTVTVLGSRDKGTTWFVLSTVESTSDGKYSLELSPNNGGYLYTRIGWIGDESFDGALSNNVEIYVEKEKIEEPEPETEPEPELEPETEEPEQETEEATSEGIPSFPITSINMGLIAFIIQFYIRKNILRPSYSRINGYP